MSGFAGLYRREGEKTRKEEIVEMTAQIAHRGPDGEGVWFDNAVGVGHQMLHTTPESLHEDLPYHDEEKGLVITADARVDNREELLYMLQLHGVSRKITDSQLILAAYDKWGVRCPEKLVGAFAFIVWDEQVNHLFCARDHIGIKPVYYYESEQLFGISSEIKSLLCLDGIPHRLKAARIGDYLTATFEDKEITFYEDIRRLPPGHTITVGPKETKIRQYWSLDSSNELPSHSDEWYAEKFREVFDEAVRCRLRSVLPIGAMLSGGIDSSAIVCTAQEILNQETEEQLHTFSARFKNVPECDEESYINAVLRESNSIPHSIPADEISPMSDIGSVLWHQDEPFYMPNLFMHRALYNATNQQNIRVLLDGFDGDTTVSHGLEYLPTLAQSGKILTLILEVRGISENFDHPVSDIVLKHVLGPLAPASVRRAWKSYRENIKGENGPSALVDNWFEQQIGLEKRRERLRKTDSKRLQTPQERHRKSLKTGLIPFALEVADKSSAAFQIEPRYPFFDKRLVEFCLALPPDQKIKRGWTRSILRRALSHRLPTEVRWRGGKSNLSPNFTRSLLAFEQDRLQDIVLRDSSTLKGYVDIPTLQEAFARYRAEQNHEDAILVWKAATLALWLRRSKVKEPVRERFEKQRGNP